jgi:hypothetical protein
MCCRYSSLVGVGGPGAWYLKRSRPAWNSCVPSLVSCHAVSESVKENMLGPAFALCPLLQELLLCFVYQYSCTCLQISISHLTCKFLFLNELSARKGTFPYLIKLTGTGPPLLGPPASEWIHPVSIRTPNWWLLYIISHCTSALEAISTLLNRLRR